MDNMKPKNIFIMALPEVEESKKITVELFEEIVTKTLLHLGEEKIHKSK